MTPKILVALSMVLVAGTACKRTRGPATPAPADPASDAVGRPPADAIVARCGPSRGPEFSGGREATAAVALDDGTILLAGRSGGGGWSSILDPSSGAMTDLDLPTSVMATRMVRAGDAAVLLGSRDGLEPATEVAHFDIGSRRWTMLPAVPSCATGNGAFEDVPVTVEPITLADGTVLVVGQRCAVVLSVDGVWSRPIPLPVRRRKFSLVRLPGGDVLRVGGLADGPSGARAASTVADRYDAASRRWSPIAPVNYTRYDQAAVRLDDGRVLVVGGCEDSGLVCHAENNPAPPAEIYDPELNRWTVLGIADVVNREKALLVPLRDGRVVVLAGFVDERGTVPPTGVYQQGRWFALPPLAVDRGGQLAVVAGDHILVSGPEPWGDRARLEWYGVAADCPATPVSLRQAPPPVGGSFP